MRDKERATELWIDWTIGSPVADEGIGSERAREDLIDRIERGFRAIREEAGEDARLGRALRRLLARDSSMKIAAASDSSGWVVECIDYENDGRGDSLLAALEAAAGGA